MNEMKKILEAIDQELVEARKKFPFWPIDAIHAAAIVVAKAGELQKAVLQYTYEFGNKAPMEKEAIQTAAMTIRFLLFLERYRIIPKHQKDN